MPRQANKTSLRQQVFKTLDGLSKVKRGVAINILMERHDVNEGYAKSLYQDHRKLRSNDESNNNFVTIYKILDIKGNYSVDPFVSKMIKQSPEPHESRNIKDAILAYKQNNINKNKLATKLK